MTKPTAHATRTKDIEALELHSRVIAERRTSDLLRNLLNAKPDPHATPAPKTKAKKATKRAK